MATLLLYLEFIGVTLLAAFTIILNLPDVTLTVGTGAALVTFGQYIAVVDAFFPIGTLVATFVGVHVVVELSIFVYKAIMWVLRKFPGVS